MQELHYLFTHHIRFLSQKQKQFPLFIPIHSQDLVNIFEVRLAQNDAGHLRVGFVRLPNKDLIQIVLTACGCVHSGKHIGISIKESDGRHIVYHIVSRYYKVCDLL